MGGIRKTGEAYAFTFRRQAVSLVAVCAFLGTSSAFAAAPASAPLSDAVLPGDAAFPAEINTLQASPDSAARTPAAIPLSDDVLKSDDAFPSELNLRLQQQEYEEALAVLMSRPDLLADEKGFMLEIQLLLKTHQDDKALILLEHRLSENPRDGLARFEVAEVHYKHGRERQAMLDYRLALAADLDEGRTDTAHARLEGIVQRKDWHIWGGASLSPNNNTNDTSDITRLALYGLPFSESAPGADKSGIAFSGYVGLGKLIALSPGLGIRTNILAAASHDPGRLFDSRSLSVQSGPEWTFGASHVSISARAIIQWLGNDVAQSGGGLSVHGDTYSDNQLWAGDVSADRLDVRYNNIGVGWNYRGELKRVRYLDASALWILDALVSRRGATFDTKSFSEGQVRVGRLFQAPLSSFVYLEATGRVRQYDRNPLFAGLRRMDDFGQVSARFTKRDLIIYGAIPYVAVLASHNESNIDTYDNNRLRFDFGFTSDF